MKNFINQIIIALASIRAGFLFAFVGVIAQAFHIYFLADQIASFENPIIKAISSTLLAIFFSGGLLYYSIKAGANKDSVSEFMKYQKIATAFAVFEGFNNVFYYIQKLILDLDANRLLDEPKYYTLIIAIPFAIALPLILKYYAGEIAVKEIQDNEEKEADTTDVVKDVLDKLKEGEHKITYTKVDHEKSDYKIKFNDNNDNSNIDTDNDTLLPSGSDSSEVSKQD